MSENHKPNNKTASAQRPSDLGKDDEALKQRLDQLGHKLESESDTSTEPKSGSKSKDARGMAEGFKIATEFTSAIIVGGMLGWLLDKGLGTSPFGLIVFFLLGFAAGVLNVLRSTKQMGHVGAPFQRSSDDPENK